MSKKQSRSRRGRLPKADVEARKEEILNAAVEELAEHGFGGVSMLGIARRAGASKETLYAWFGNRDGLFAAMIQAQSATTIAAVDVTLNAELATDEVLRNIAIGLLTLLTGERSAALNRAAMGSPELAALLLLHGRNTTGPRIIAWFRQFEVTDCDGDEVPPHDAFEILYGLTMRDRQIRTLLGAVPPSQAEIELEANHAVKRFRRLIKLSERTT